MHGMAGGGLLWIEGMLRVGERGGVMLGLLMRLLLGMGLVQR